MQPIFSIPVRGFLLLLFVAAVAGCTTPNHVYLTWQNDPRSTMTVNFQTPDKFEGVQLLYDLESRDGDIDAYRESVSATGHQVPGLRDGRYIYHLEADELQPGALYHFVIAADGKALTDELRFRPLPSGNAPIRFVAAGDMGILPRAYQLAKLAGETEPMFALIGGDLAYANGKLSRAWMWDKWLNLWEDNMTGDDGVLLPMVLAIGNHEVNDIDGTLEQMAPFYYGYFAQGGLPYFTRSLRDDTTLIVLDTGHTIPHGGAQRDWLEEALIAEADTRNTIALYHAPLYPSHRDFDDGRAVKGREHWLPLFDQYGLRVALENHDHTFKRTKVLKDNQVAEEGTVYLGDGSFGVNPRNIPEPDRWYLEKASGTPHFWLVDIDDSGMHFKAISHADDVLDEISFE